ncbi:two-component system response regulator [Massilia sp. Root418]|uniref:response regulator n=1 Tax=Massilia sp. Root418 TaxID=1736532 RepID=UPI0006F771BD|nr:response regulator [Massilia sp. Root418]KQX01608.1 two-component system response regulator [Massilia sp. Root418]
MNEEDMLASRVLIIDDQPANLRLLEELLAREGLTHVVGTTDARKALELYAAFDPDLIVLDLMMPDLDGYAVLEHLKRRGDPYDFRPVLVVTADATGEAKRRALSLGAKDFLTKPFDTIEAMLRVWNLLETRALYKRLQALSPSEPPIARWPPSARGR